MHRESSDWIRNIFTAGSRDLTPAFVHGDIHVLYVAVSRDPEVSRRCASVLSDTELQRANRFGAEHHRARFEQRRAFRRFCGATAVGSPEPLSRIDFEETAKGQPYLPGRPEVCFSFSSCRFGLLGAWSSTHGVGVDLEDPTRHLEAAALARRFFATAEANTVEELSGPARLRTFFQLWTLKEAALKAIGEGLPFGLDAFELELDPKPRVVRAPAEHGGPDRFDAHRIEGTGGWAALVTRSQA